MTASTPPRVCFYARCSLSRDVVASLDHQLEHAKRWCDQNDMTLSDVVVEDRVGPNTFVRPRFQRLMGEVLHGTADFDVLLVHSSCRITRNPELLALLLRRLKRANVEVKLITGEMPADLA